MLRSIDSLCELATRCAGLVVPANYNTAEQIVVSGEVAGVERLMELAKEAGAKRAVRASVSGAFHSPLMEPAARARAKRSNRDDVRGTGLSSFLERDRRAGRCRRSEARELLATQLTAPVRWAGEITNIACPVFRTRCSWRWAPAPSSPGLLHAIVPGARGMACGTRGRKSKNSSLKCDEDRSDRPRRWLRGVRGNRTRDAATLADVERESPWSDGSEARRAAVAPSSAGQPVASAATSADTAAVDALVEDVE